jgi:hypothetical protein
MKQKFVITKNSADGQLLIQEYAELDRDMLSLLCEESYSLEALQSAMKEGTKVLTAFLRTKNLYPPGMYAERLATAVTTLMQDEAQESVEVMINDIELLASEREAAEANSSLEKETADIDELLEDEGKKNFEEDLDIDESKPSFKISEDEVGDVEEQS